MAENILDVRLEDGSTAPLPANPTTGGVLSVSGTPPITSSGGNTPAIGITAASDVAAGSMSAADKTKLDGIEPDSTPSVVTSTNFGQATGVAIPNTSTFTSLVDGPIAITIPVGGGSVILLGSITAGTGATAGVGNAALFVDNAEQGIAQPLALPTSATGDGAVAFSAKVGPLAAGAHTIDLKAQAAIAATANGQLVGIIVTA